MAKNELFTPLTDDPFWYKDAIIYELHVRAFYDQNGDGIGDFRGLTEKLPYLQDLGVTVLWLLPFYPSPLKDDGYDIANYNEVNPIYGNLQDVKHFVREAHRRGLRIITELVCNHTSSEHPWFQKSRNAKPGSAWRNFYVWSDSPDRYKEARIIFKDFETSNWAWDPVAQAYYWHRFYAHQPDLNFANPQVHKAIFKAMDFWLQMGIDGLRLDAIPYLYEREGTNCENLPETHAFLQKLRRHVDEKYPNRILLAEANQWTEDAVAYFGKGDECHMSFHFPLMPRMFMAIYMEDRFPVLDILEQTPAIPETAQWALFLRNHDELTLEMVTDEERDYMYRVYAKDTRARINLGIRRRLAPLLGNNRRRIELMNGLLFSLPGTPVIYYGDEIGMGDNIYLGDRNGVRTPMQWSPDRNAGFSTGNSQRLFLPVIVDPEYHYEAINVEAQQSNPHALLWWMKRLIALRKQHKAFGQGSLEMLHPENRKILAFIRRYETESILVVANLSRFVQFTDLNLPSLRGFVPVEMFGSIEFPQVIETQPYLITLGPHSFYWFHLQTPVAPVLHPQEMAVPQLEARGPWQTVCNASDFATILPKYLVTQRWFGGKSRKIKATKVIDTISALNDSTKTALILLLKVDYTEGSPETYVLPIAFAPIEQLDQLQRTNPKAIIARLHLTDTNSMGVLYDALVEPAFCQALLSSIAGRRKLKGRQGREILATTMGSAKFLPSFAEARPETRLIKGEQSNSSVVFGDQFILKIFRRVDTGLNPDLEIGRFLTERDFGAVPQVVGALEYPIGDEAPMTLGILQQFIRNEGDAWSYTLDTLNHFTEQALALPAGPPTLDSRVFEPLLATKTFLTLMKQELSLPEHELIRPYLGSASLLGQRTAELHLALAADSQNAAFAPEPFTTLYQRSIYQSMRSTTTQVLQTLRKALPNLPETVQLEAQKVLELEGSIFKHFLAIKEQPIKAARIRCHGDYHLGQVLFTGRDFVITDFEGEPARPLSERRIKRSPMHDVAGMLRSFHYASYATLSLQTAGGNIRPVDLPALEPWLRWWYLWVSTNFLKAYLTTAHEATFLPANQNELAILLDLYLLERALCELGYELDNRPEWVKIPLQAILYMLTEGIKPKGA